MEFEIINVLVVHTNTTNRYITWCFCEIFPSCKLAKRAENNFCVLKLDWAVDPRMDILLFLSVLKTQYWTWCLMLGLMSSMTVTMNNMMTDEKVNKRKHVEINVFDKDSLVSYLFIPLIFIGLIFITMVHIHMYVHMKKISSLCRY